MGSALPSSRSELGVGRWGMVNRIGLVTVPARRVLWLYGLYALTCPECGAEGEWTLRRYGIERGAQPDRVEIEPRADAVCGECEVTVEHPLIYPAIVTAANEWADAGRPADAQPDAVDEWRPHYLAVATPDPLDSGYEAAGTWLPWERLGGAECRRRWPELVDVWAAWVSAVTAVQEQGSPDIDAIVVDARRRLDDQS
ncbi:hypothetical protein STSO111631_21475 [Stackebrandtia soli]